MRLLILAAAVLVPSLAFAQMSPRARQPVTTMVIDDDEPIPGTHKVPGGIIVEADPDVKHSSLLKIRESFADRVLDSSKQLP